MFNVPTAYATIEVAELFAICSGHIGETVAIVRDNQEHFDYAPFCVYRINLVEYYGNVTDVAVHYRIVGGSGRDFSEEILRRFIERPKPDSFLLGYFRYHFGAKDLYDALRIGSVRSLFIDEERCIRPIEPTYWWKGDSICWSMHDDVMEFRPYIVDKHRKKLKG